MDQPKVTASIDRDGKITIEVDGVHGEGCEALTAALEAALGDVETRKIKPEHFVKPTQGKIQTRGGSK